MNVEFSARPVRTAGASVRGPSHEDDGSACQDAFERVCFGDIAVAVVCDGAGTACKGGEAARFIARHLVTLSTESGHELSGLTKGIRSRKAVKERLARFFEIARDGLLQKVADAQADPDEYLCTVVAVFVHRKFGGFIAHIGDGAVVGRGPGDRWLCLSGPENGEYANTTYFLIEDHWKDHLRFSSISKRITSLFLMSDGAFELSCLRTGGGPEPHVGFFNPVAAFLEQSGATEGDAALSSTLDSERARARDGDDKTLVWIEVKASGV